MKYHQEIDTESMDFLIAQGMQESPRIPIEQIPEEINETTEKFVSKIPSILEGK